MMLSSLLSGVEFTFINPPQNIPSAQQPITGISADSRQVSKGSVFFAVVGSDQDGHRFIVDAVDKGCSAIVCMKGKVERETLRQLPATVVEVDDTARAYAVAAANYCDRPAEKMCCVGVTGTNGKTTVTYLLEHVLLRAGFSVGVIGTVTNRYTNSDGRKKVIPAQLTTPEALRLQQLLKEMADNHVDYVIMEVSSHGLAQSRVDPILFDVVAFTNLSRDHLDYHRDMADYFGAKLLLFTDHLKRGATAVLPQLPDASPKRGWLASLHSICRLAGSGVITWGQEESASVRFLSHTLTIDRTEVDIQTAGGHHRIVSPLVGYYNIENLLTVYGLCLAVGIKESFICSALGSAVGAPGRLERVAPEPPLEPDSPVILVDYAHTPDALEKVLETVNALPHERL
ncbi:MAG: Mur ligase family protein, partial [Desulforhopalus sp.]